jgi:multicomponent Na+:H+ antiporter subunit E
MTPGPTVRLGPLGRNAVLATVLVGIWILLWGELSLANVVAGLAIAVALLWTVPADDRRPETVVRPVALVRLGLYVLRQMVVSNTLLVRAVVSREAATNTGVLAVPMPDCSPQVITVTAALMTLTPGSMPVEADLDVPVLYVHVLDLRDLATVRKGLLQLRDLTIRAIGSASAVEATR